MRKILRPFLWVLIMMVCIAFMNLSYHIITLVLIGQWQMHPAATVISAISGFFMGLFICIEYSDEVEDLLY